MTEYWIKPGNTPADAYVIGRAYGSDHGSVYLLAAGWVQFTPLQQWQNAMHLLDCTPLRVAVPRIGSRLAGSLYMFSMEG